MAVEAHRRQLGGNLANLTYHPKVANIVLEEIGVDLQQPSVLLARCGGNTEVTLKDIHEQFGDRVALIVDGLTKLDGLHETESPQAENLGKVLRTMLSDVRVVLIKMADRLHNMRTIKSIPNFKQKKIAAETSFIMLSGASPGFYTK
ncbi:MAG: HD domain-containing protein [Saprospiraceae bacterium]